MRFKQINKKHIQDKYTGEKYTIKEITGLLNLYEKTTPENSREEENYFLIKEILANILEYCNKLVNINYQTNRQTEIQEQMLRRLDYQNRQLELTNNLLLEVIQCSDRDELCERVNGLVNKGY